MKKQLLLALAIIAVLFSACTKDPTASFTPSATTATVGEVITFSDASSEATHYIWDFGDGTSHSTAKNPTHTYMAAGEYTVTLQVFSTNYKKSAETTAVITVNLDAVDQKLADFETVWLMFLGTWDYDKWEYKHLEDGTEVTADAESEAYSVSTYEFLENGNSVYTDEDANESTSLWNLIDENRVGFTPNKAENWNPGTSDVFTIKTLTANSMVLESTTIQEGFPAGTIDTYINTYTFSR